MDETLEKKLRALKLKLVMAEKELMASSGKWKLGALLGAGHTSAMNREVVKLKERLEGKIEKLRNEIAKITGEAPAPKAEVGKPIAKTEPAMKPVVEKATVKEVSPVKNAAAKRVATPAEKKAAATKAAPAKSTTKSAAKKSGKK
ncbi:MAG: hypothetical protein IPP40_03935 [bacterium]|nr:hypothetical protein [bacterium]